MLSLPEVSTCQSTSTHVPSAGPASSCCGPCGTPGAGQPCPECDAEAGPTVPTGWNAYTYRDGNPRLLPDNGKFRHLGHEVSKPYTGGTGSPLQHPEVTKPQPTRAPSVEEAEQYAHKRELQRNADLERGGIVERTEVEGERREFLRRLRAPAASQRDARVTRRIAADTERKDAAVKQQLRTEAKVRQQRHKETR